MAFPKSGTITWNPNPPSEQVTSYKVAVNSVLVGTSATNSLPYTFPTPGSYLIQVAATNGEGDGPPGSLSYNLIDKPTQVINIQVVLAP